MDTNETPRALTHDEQKAAEAAFAGRPFNPAWSESARIVYEGLTRALPLKAESHDVFSAPESPPPSLASESESPVVPDSSQEASITEPHEPPAAGTEETAKRLISNRQEAIEAGVLIDVTPEAQKLGLTFPVTVTRPLWELGIAPIQTLSDEEKSNRLRDVLMAFRLRLSSLVMLSPLIDFPAILALPPETVPQPVPLFALLQPDAKNQTSVTLLLPNEVSLSIAGSNYRDR
jgi:hypothetical protein